MYQNVGRKIMQLAKVLGWLFLILGFILAILFWSDDEALTGFISLFSGILSYFLSLPLYGFGQLIEDVGTIKRQAGTAGEEPRYTDLPDL